MPVATLSVDMTMRLARLEEGIERAVGHLGNLSAKAQGTAQSIRNSFAGNLLANLAMQIGQSIGALPAAVLESLDRLNDLKDATGSSIENLSALEDVGLRTGTAFDSLSGMLVKFNKSLGDAKDGDEVSNIIEGIGLSVAELKALDPADALHRVAIALSQFADDGQKARAIQELFGKSVREAAPYLNELAKQTGLVATTNAEAAAEAEKFQQALSGMGKNLLDFGRNIGSIVLPVLNGLVDKLREVGKEIRAAGNAADQERNADRAAQSEKLRQDQIAATNRLLADQNIQGERRERLQQRLRQLEMPVPPERAPKGGDRPPPPARDNVETRPSIPSYKVPEKTPKGPRAPAGPKPPDLIKETANEVDRYIDRLRAMENAERVAHGSRTELQRAQLELASDPELARATEAQRARILESAAAIDRLRQGYSELEVAARQRLEAMGREDEAERAAQEAYEKHREEIAAIVARTPSGQADAVAAEVDRLNALLRDGEITAQQYGEAFRVALEGLPDRVRETTDEMSEFAKEAQANIQDSLGQTLRRTLAGDFKSIGELWKNTLLDMAAQAAATKLNEALFGTKGGDGGIWGSILGALGFGGAGKGPTGPGDPGGAMVSTDYWSMPMRAGGGGVEARSIARVNERGLEMARVSGKDYLLTGSAPAHITPAEKVRGGGDTFVWNIAAGVTKNELAAMVPAMEAQIMAKITARQRRPGYAGA